MCVSVPETNQTPITFHRYQAHDFLVAATPAMISDNGPSLI